MKVTKQDSIGAQTWTEDMPSVSDKQQRFMGAEYGRAKRGEKTETGMSKKQLREFAKSRKGRRGKKRR